MIKSRYEEVTVTKKRPVKSITYCDVCGKLIGTREWDGAHLLPTEDSHKYYWECTTSHNDWGRDSVDSIENAEICSKECLKEWIDEYLNDPDDYATREFSIQHTQF